MQSLPVPTMDPLIWIPLYLIPLYLWWLALSRSSSRNPRELALRQFVRALRALVRARGPRILVYYPRGSSSAYGTPQILTHFRLVHGSLLVHRTLAGHGPCTTCTRPCPTCLCISSSTTFPWIRTRHSTPADTYSCTAPLRPLLVYGIPCG